ncbi:fumarylacetoacetate hydrolase family protein [Alicyclobacillus tolerans]|uniref:fumarylacetoacetate hydrolase family protein n=1 Tax=Alicyclobacillus tolerans TaxID=90970 RepID=UPI001F48DD3C|nr:fumarylacetoacetate hydrolase family protein [Alicyclobacillus tolerans]MCF8565825.1 fumarylacetoacetate hydrolase family protein [Alicyclobacillus tolerans]
MRLVTIKNAGREEAAVRFGDRVVPVRVINEVFDTRFATDMLGLLETESLPSLSAAAAGITGQDLGPLTGQSLALSECQFGPLYRRPRKIWGIGLNYREHAGDLSAIHPTEEPASFMKSDTTIIGPGDDIVLPVQSERVTAEAEIAVVIGKECKNVSLEDAPSVIAGFTPVIDMTAEDILQKNPRFLTRAKNFDTFFSFGPELLTPEEISDLHNLTVGTYNNGSLHRENVVANMQFLPYFLVSFHSRVMTLLPGDIISTGTPGAVVIRNGDKAECRIDGFLPLANPVRQDA